MYADPACIHHWPLVGSMIIQTRAGDLSTTRHNTPKQAHQPQHIGKGIAIDHGCNRQMIMICVDASIDMPMALRAGTKSASLTACRLA
jgi:hypothetical protein